MNILLLIGFIVSIIAVAILFAMVVINSFRSSSGDSLDGQPPARPAPTGRQGANLK